MSTGMKRGRNGNGNGHPKRKAFVPARARARRIARPGELKFHDVDFDDAVIASAGTVGAAGTINIIPQGVTEIQRIGRKCTVTKIGWRYQVTIPEVVDAATPPAGDSVRVILYRDSQANGATIAVLDLLETANFQSFFNLANQRRFHVLMDRTHVINLRTITSTQNADTFDSPAIQQNYTFFKDCSIALEFSAAAGALTELTSNNINVLLISASGAAGLNSKFRLRFSDGS